MTLEAVHCVCEIFFFKTIYLALMTRSIEALGVRFKLLSSALNMIQGDNSCRISRNVLRQRIYATAFDYFTIPAQNPVQKIPQLRYDVRQLIGFWQALYADGKYIKKEAFITNGIFFLTFKTYSIRITI